VYYNKKVKSLIIIPAYNESKNLISLIREVESLGYDYLIINDNSTDETKELACSKGYNIINLCINVGLAGVTRLGFKYAIDNGYDCAISVDGDGQHPPKYINKLIKEIENGCDYVVGSRFITNKKPVSMRMIGSRLICLLIKIKTKKTVTDPTSGMRALGRKVLEDFSKEMNYYAEPDALCHCLKKDYKIQEVQVEMNDREEGESYFTNPFKSLKFMIAIIVSILFIQ